MASTSHLYVAGLNTIGKPHYFVELSEDMVRSFETLSSLASLNAFEKLLYICENELASGRLPIIPNDVMILLLTLAGISPHYKDHVLRNHDSMNVGRINLSYRALRLLSTLFDIVIRFDSDLYSSYDLELLRCQYFILVDSLTPTNKIISPITTHKLSNVITENKLNFSRKLGTYINYYGSYISALETKFHVFNNLLITYTLFQEGKLWNCIAWCLTNSTSNDEIKYYCGRHWLSVVKLILRLFDLRHTYYKNHELSNDDEKSLYLSKFMKSPLYLLFQSLDQTQIHIELCNCLFTNSDVFIKNKDICPVYHTELILSTTYLDTTISHNIYKLKTLMKLKRHILGLYFKLTSDIPKNEKIPLISLSDNQTINYIIGIVKKMSFEEFETFFFTTNLSEDMNYLPLLAERMIIELLSDIDIILKIDIVNSLKTHYKMADTIRNLIRKRPVNLDLNFDIEKCNRVDCCIILIMKYAVFCHGTSVFKNNVNFVTFLNETINNELCLIKMGNLLSPTISHALKSIFKLQL